jgi:hypothetical protein
VRAASTRPTLGEFLSRLANHFGLQQVPPQAVEIAQELRPWESALLDLAYREHIPLAMRAVMAAKAAKAAHYGPLFETPEEPPPDERDTD